MGVGAEPAGQGGWQAGGGARPCSVHRWEQAMRLYTVRAPGEGCRPRGGRSSRGRVDGLPSPRWPELARGRLRQRGQEEAGHPADGGTREGGRMGSRPTAAGAREGAIASSADGGNLAGPRKAELERGGRLGSRPLAWRPDAREGELASARTGGTWPDHGRRSLSGWAVG